MGGSRKRRQTRKSQKGGGARYIPQELTPEITDGDSLKENMEMYFVSGHGESQVDSYFCVPDKTFILFNANAGNFGYMRAKEQSWLRKDNYYENIFKAIYGNSGNQTVALSMNESLTLAMKSDTIKFNESTPYKESNYRLPSTQIYFPGDFLPNHLISFNNTTSFRPMGIFKVPMNPENKLLTENIWPEYNSEQSYPENVYYKLKHSAINTSSLPNVQNTQLPIKEMNSVLAPFSDYPEVVGKEALLTHILHNVRPAKKYRFFFLPVCRGAPPHFDPGRKPTNLKTSINTPAFKLFRRMSIASRTNMCKNSESPLSLSSIFTYKNDTEYNELLELSLNYFKATGDERFYNYAETLPSLKYGHPVGLTFYSFLVAMATHPIPKEFKGTLLEMSLKNLTHIFKPITRNIIETFPKKNNTRRQAQQLLTNTFSARETGYSFFHNAPPRINEYGEEVGEVFSNAKNAPEHIKIARGNNI